MLPPLTAILIDPYLHRVIEVCWPSGKRQFETISTTTQHHVGVDAARLRNGDSLLLHDPGCPIGADELDSTQRYFEYDGGFEDMYAGLGLIIGGGSGHTIPKTTLAQARKGVTWIGRLITVRGISRRADPVDLSITVDVMVLNCDYKETWMPVADYQALEAWPRVVINLPLYPEKIMP